MTVRLERLWISLRPKVGLRETYIVRQLSALIYPGRLTAIMVRRAFFFLFFFFFICVSFLCVQIFFFFDILTFFCDVM
jgi:hypothetical protein